MSKLNQNPIQMQATNVNGAVLTENCLQELKDLQEEDNSLLSSARDSVSDTICFLAKNIEDLHNDPEIPRLMIRLGCLRDSLHNLRKP